MPVPTTGSPKSLGKIRQELESTNTSDDYDNGPYTTDPTSLEDASTGNHVALNNLNLIGTPTLDDAPYSMDEFSSYDQNSTKVLCTELYNQGILSEELYKADCALCHQRYSQTLMHSGYLIFAYWPLWLLKNKKKFAKKYMHHILISWAKYMAYEYGTIEYKDRAGQILLYLGLIFSPILGLLSKLSKNTIYHKILSTMCFIISFIPLLGYSCTIKMWRKLWA
jgi:hypothetical protein